MNIFKYQAMVEEFPALSEIQGSVEDCDGIFVKRADNALVHTIPWCKYAVGSLVGIRREQEVVFVLNNGEVINGAVLSGGSEINNYAHHDNSQWAGETILEAIHKRKVARELDLIIIVESGYNVHDHHSGPNWRATIYKTPKKVSYSDLIEREIEKAKCEVAAQANF